MPTEWLCIARPTRIGEPPLAWCDRRSMKRERHFRGLDHAVKSQMHGSALHPCPRCIESGHVALLHNAATPSPDIDPDQLPLFGSV